MEEQSPFIPSRNGELPVFSLSRDFISRGLQPGHINLGIYEMAFICGELSKGGLLLGGVGISIAVYPTINLSRSC